MKTTGLKILTLLTGLSFLFFLNSCADADGSEKKDEEAGSFTYVQIMKAKSEPFVKYISLIGVAKPFKTADIAAEEGGIIAKFSKDKGAYVKDGEVILVLKNEVLKANLDAAKAQYDMAETNFRKQEEIYRQKVTSELQFLNSKYERDAAKANYELIKSRYEKTFIKAPFSGIVDQKYIEEGEFAGPGTPIITLVSIDRIKVEAGVPENYVNDVKAGNNVKVIFNDLEKAEYNEKISYVGSSIDRDNRTFLIEILILNKGRKIKPELNAEVKVEKEMYKDVVVIPENIVTETDQGNIVFVEENGAAKMRVVEVVSRFDNKAAVNRGLKEGENLIHVGYQNLIDGEKVKVLE